MQYDDQLGELQITLQEVISIIDSLIEKETIENDGRQEEIIKDYEKQEKTIEDDRK